jgi:hypothetical protein
MAGLRDFQRETARYAYQRLFGDREHATSRFLVADEVGLGKTLVARGVIAQIIEHLQREGDRRIDIVYVASNAAIAGQNLRKLAPKGVEIDHHTGRLSLLPFNLDKLGSRDVNLIALTPRTSMDLRSSGGTFEERAAVLAALRTVWGGNRVKGKGISRVFAGGISDGPALTREERVRAKAVSFGTLPPKAQRHLKDALRGTDRKRRREGRLTLDEELHELAAAHNRGRVSAEVAGRRAVLIRELREAMAWTGVQMLQPDLVILDEFQRFKELLSEDSDDWTGELARTMFTYEHKRERRQARVLLLSATPYVMHTTTAEAAAGADRHYDDFLATYRFLAAGEQGADAEGLQSELQTRLSSLRTSILDAEVDGAEPVRRAATDVAAQLTRVMVRTERLASTADHNGMLRTIRDHVGAPSPAALRQYVDAARVGDHLQRAGLVGSGDVLEYWKSAPYTLSFLGGHEYLLSQRLFARLEDKKQDVDLLDLMSGNKALIPWLAVQRYDDLDDCNGRLACLYSDFFDSGAHRLLWMPASAPYYVYGGRFDTEEARRLTKRLIFSSWTLVPTVVSTMMTYEAERRLHHEAAAAGAQTKSYDTEANKRHTRHLQLGTGTQSMSAMQFRVPSPALARLTDPLALSVEIGAETSAPRWESLFDAARSRVVDALAGYLPANRSTGQGSAAWYLLAGFLLDHLAEPQTGYGPGMLEALLSSSTEDSQTLRRHSDQLQAWFARIADLVDDEVSPDEADSRWAGLPPVPEDLEEVLALAGLAGPASCLFRSLTRRAPGLAVTDLVRHTLTAADAFVSLLNSWEATRVITAMPREGDFWLKALHYCAEGNLQSVLDEYVAVLAEWRGYDRLLDEHKKAEHLVADLATVLSLRTSSYKVLKAGAQGPERDAMRGRFAVRFGEATSEDNQAQRVDAVSLAFNSPFWPFVLTSTSVGQEGLDFHLYCHAISHWNLPGNPVDLEQREGRVHRYKGHAVRKNVAVAEGPPRDLVDPWTALFERARARVEGQGTSDIVPFWVYVPEHLPEEQLSRIERHLPITPLSREASRIDPLLASVAFYRLAFGQPRQEELVDHVLNRISDDALRAELAEVRVDLSPRVGTRA